ncbi:DUF4184 family protein [Paenibacillus endoradicis]|uniref:DUF4184 family protein n=1 Tax=Paenibacillus endoradicis TaxID=2972487 RepID=UPI00215931A0|nr:DUF4184 family protein [Paenibacillus endoradicis]MCR8656631.1 DUF4184 family protein [Paenibacillus endoradicis]
MPFTLSHAMFAIPIKYIKPKYFSTTGLILGSMSPDLEYFVKLEPYRSIGHSMLGLILQAIPLSMIIAYLVHHVIKVPLSLHITSRYDLNTRFYHFLQLESLKSFRSWIVLIMSIIIGFVTHILIDGFTHAHGFFVDLMPVLNDVLLMNIPTYKALQYGSSIMGFGLLCCLLGYYLYRSNTVSTVRIKVTKQQKYKYWLIVILTAILVTLLKLVLSTSHNVLGIMFVAPISGIFLGITVSSIVWRMRMSIT